MKASLGSFFFFFFFSSIVPTTIGFYFFSREPACSFPRLRCFVLFSPILPSSLTQFCVTLIFRLLAVSATRSLFKFVCISLHRHCENAAAKEILWHLTFTQRSYLRTMMMGHKNINGNFTLMRLSCLNFQICIVSTKKDAREK